MADSADVLLARARNALARWANAKPGTSAEWMSATDLVDAVTDLDALLSSGGPLPAAWAAPVAEMRRVTDVTGPQECVTCGAWPGSDCSLYDCPRVSGHVEHCTAAVAEEAMATLSGEKPGTVIRVTDTGTEYVLTGGGWVIKPRYGQVNHDG